MATRIKSWSRLLASGSFMTLKFSLGAKVSRHDPRSGNLYRSELVRPQIISRWSTTCNDTRILFQTTTSFIRQGALKASSVTSNTAKADMSHESVWFSRPRTYGKGSRQWYVTTHFSPLLCSAKLTIIAVPARTKLVSSANTGSTCAVNVSGRRHTMLGSRRYGFDRFGLGEVD